jgi:hypothetical protein
LQNLFLKDLFEVLVTKITKIFKSLTS